MGISLCMIVKNEEQFLEQALRSVKHLVDEIVIVDTGSTDQTKEIARRFTSHLFEYAWSDNFSVARNFSLSKATQDWILVLDADEIVAVADHPRILSLIQQTDTPGFSFVQVSYTADPSVAGYLPVLQKTSYTKHFPGYIAVNMIRLFRNHLDIYFEGAVHETVEYRLAAVGAVVKTDIPIHHYQFEKGEDVLREKQLHYLALHEQHLSTYPNQAKAYRDMGSTYYSYTDNTTKALQYFEQSLALKQHPKTYVGLVLCLVKLRRFATAQEKLREGLHSFPDDVTLRHLLSAFSHSP